MCLSEVVCACPRLSDMVWRSSVRPRSSVGPRFSVFRTVGQFDNPVNQETVVAYLLHLVFAQTWGSVEVVDRL